MDDGAWNLLHSVMTRIRHRYTHTTSFTQQKTVTYFPDLSVSGLYDKRMLSNALILVGLGTFCSVASSIPSGVTTLLYQKVTVTPHGPRSPSLHPQSQHFPRKPEKTPQFIVHGLKHFDTFLQTCKIHKFHNIKIVTTCFQLRSSNFQVPRRGERKEPVNDEAK